MPIEMTASTPDGKPLGRWARDDQGNLIDPHPGDDLDAAIALLMMSAETCDHNAPIHADGGNHAQADLCRANAASYRAAIARLVP